MAFIPLVQRELTAASRKKGTFRLRWFIAFFAAAITFISLIFIAFAQRGGAGVGGLLYRFITTYTFGLCLLAGIFLTSDCISEEKREGTLELLFLAGLRGFDIIAGKLLVRSLNAVFGLIATFPIIAISLIAGGLTVGEFWRMGLALLNALFVSLAIGVFASAWARTHRDGSGATIGLLAAVVAAPACLAWIGGNSGWPSFLSGIAWLSPVEAFRYARVTLYSTGPLTFWAALGCSHAIGWTFAAAAAATLNRAPGGVQSNPGAATAFLSRMAALSPTWRRRKQRYQELLQKNPISWLASRGATLTVISWLLVICWGIFLIVKGVTTPGDPITIYPAAKVWGFGFKILIANQACRFFMETRQSGWLEILLCTPLTSREIVKGQFMALRRYLAWPIGTFLVLAILPVWFLIFSTASSGGISQLLTALLGLGGGMATILWFFVFFIIDALAICWLGMWLALSMRKPKWAAPLTVILVLVIPSPICVLDVIADLVFILWGATRLQQDFRYTAARYGQVGARQKP
jgi:ABC-type transport system involved in multi-copper enzyme maturation permease subunit